MLNSLSAPASSRSGGAQSSFSDLGDDGPQPIDHIRIELELSSGNDRVELGNASEFGDLGNDGPQPIEHIRTELELSRENNSGLGENDKAAGFNDLQGNKSDISNFSGKEILTPDYESAKPTGEADEFGSPIYKDKNGVSFTYTTGGAFQAIHVIGKDEDPKAKPAAPAYMPPAPAYGPGPTPAPVYSPPSYGTYSGGAMTTTLMSLLQQMLDMFQK